MILWVPLLLVSYPMNNHRCPITYDTLPEGRNYSERGLKTLSPKLDNLNPLAYTAKELLQETQKRTSKMSIQGVQPKLSATLSIKNECFKIVDIHGKFILKPPSPFYPELPQNEAVTMSMAKLFGIEVPPHGMVHNKDNTFTYFIKRFDRIGHNQKIAMEDFAQLAGLTRDTKYRYSMEKLVSIVEQHCTFPLIEKAELFKRVLFNYLVGNEDMHLKNYSLLSKEGKVSLAPAYDFLNSTIAIGNAKEEIALALNGKKNNLRKKDLIEYFGKTRLALPQQTIDGVLASAETALPTLFKLLKRSLLSKSMIEQYDELLQQRAKIIFS